MGAALGLVRVCRVPPLPLPTGVRSVGPLLWWVLTHRTVPTVPSHGALSFPATAFESRRALGGRRVETRQLAFSPFFAGTWSLPTLVPSLRCFPHVACLSWWLRRGMLSSLVHRELDVTAILTRDMVAVSGSFLLLLCFACYLICEY